jgi:hypothetical protein
LLAAIGLALRLLLSIIQDLADGNGDNPSSFSKLLCFVAASRIEFSISTSSAWVAARSISVSSVAVLTYREYSN